MLLFEFKTYGKPQQFAAIDDAIRTCQFVRNKALRFWIDNSKATKYDLNKHCAVLAREFPFAEELNSQARQAAAERAWAAISRFYAALASSRETRPTQCLENCKNKVLGKKGYPQFQNDC